MFKFSRRYLVLFILFLMVGCEGGSYTVNYFPKVFKIFTCDSDSKFTQISSIGQIFDITKVYFSHLKEELMSSIVVL